MNLIGRFLILLLAVTAGACASSGAVPRPRPFPGAALPPDGERPPVAAEPGAVPEVVQAALDLRGTPYRNGGSDPTGFDCSGFVQWVFSQAGLRLPREVKDQFKVGSEIDLVSVRPGDLVFFETVSKGASHVGLAIGGDRFVHAPSSTGVVRIERFTSSYWMARFVGARRIEAEATKNTRAN